MGKRRVLAPIVTRKHYVHRTNASIASGALVANLVTDAVVAPATTLASDVAEGSVVKAVHLEIWLRSGGVAGSTTQFIVIVEKLPTGNPIMTAAQSLNLGAYPNKKNILYTTQGVIGGTDNNSIAVLRDWILIPKGKQRQGLGDRIVVNVSTVGQAMNNCGLFTYKEFQ